MLFRLAWRNIWRNKRRTLITMASVFFAVIIAVIMRSAITGIYDHMVSNVVRFSSGYIQVHAKGYWDEKTIDLSFKENKSLYTLVEQSEGVAACVPRLESFALASAGDKTRGVMVQGIDPEKENSISQLKDKLLAGVYPGAGSSGVLLSEGLASYLRLQCRDTIVLLSQGYHGSNAAGKFEVCGIVRYGSPELNKRLVNIPLRLMQELYGAENMLSSLSVMLEKGSRMQDVKESISGRIDTMAYEVMDWKQMMPELDQLIEADTASDSVVIGVLYLVIAFGVFGTVLMMTRERMHEFGILLAIGMKKRILASVLVMESFMMAFTAALAGMLGALPVVLWFNRHPIRLGKELQAIYERYGMEAILPLSAELHVFLEQALVVFGISLVLSLYAGGKIFTLKVMDALRN